MRQQKPSTTGPAIVALLHEVEAGQPLRVPLVQGQSARGLRTAISRAAGGRGIDVETVTGDGFVGVRKVDALRLRKSGSSPGIEGQRRRGRPPKRQDADAAEIAGPGIKALGEN